jgi:hypothetical protein
MKDSNHFIVDLNAAVFYDFFLTYELGFSSLRYELTELN